MIRCSRTSHIDITSKFLLFKTSTFPLSYILDLKHFFIPLVLIILSLSAVSFPEKVIHKRLHGVRPVGWPGR